MPPALPDAVRDYVRTHYTMTLATTRQDRPWAATVFYAADDDLRLYFVSDPKTRHATEGEANPNVAVTIYEHDQDWSSIRGIQIEGRLDVVAREARDAVEARYVARFPVIGRLLRAATSEAERLVGRRFAAATFYVVRPGRLRFIDNTRGFGHKDEYVIDDGALHH
jgi:uncharacterized protein YhbP (UPF0306 family)